MRLITNLDRNLSPIFTLHVSLLSNHGRVLGRLQAGNIFKELLKVTSLTVHFFYADNFSTTSPYVSINGKGILNRGNANAVQQNNTISLSTPVS